MLLFLLMPLAALLLKGAYFRQHRHYVSHLIFTAHMQCVLFVFVALLLLEKLRLPEAFDALMLGGPMVSFVVALRTFYQQSWGRTLLKAGALGLAYGATILVAAVLVGMGGLLYF